MATALTIRSNSETEFLVFEDKSRRRPFNTQSYFRCKLPREVLLSLKVSRSKRLALFRSTALPSAFLEAVIPRRWYVQLLGIAKTVISDPSYLLPLLYTF